MTGQILIGVSNIAKKPSKIYTGVNNIAKEVKEIYAGDVNGIARKVWPMGILPDGYKMLEYVFKSNDDDDCLIYTGINETPQTEILLEITPVWRERISSYGAGNVYGERETYGIGYHSEHLFMLRMNPTSLPAPTDENNKISFQYTLKYSRFDENSISTERNYSYDTKYTIELNRNYCEFVIDNNVIKQFEQTTYVPSNEILIFGQHWFYSNTSSGYSSDGNAFFRLHHFSIKQSHSLVRDFYPCYRTSDEKTGLYDLITNTFYYPTDALARGPEVN